ncbi:MAG: hypothetical protein C0617_08785 [Desulfuromonas sp.]|nr:MAG: hypothetical protein C0617_08785 [Desulfuromonas sp.]
MFTEAGELLALEGFISDVSDRKEAKEQIESLARFPKENTNPVLRVSAEGTLLFANKGGMALLPFLGKGLGEPVNENWRERLGEALALDRARECEEQFGERWYSLSLVPVSEGGYINLYGRDVTKRHRAEEALRHSEEQVRLLLDSTAEAIYGLDPAGNCTFVNPSCLRMLGYADESELLGNNMHDLIHHHRIDGSLYPKEECQVYLAFKEGRGVHTDAEVLWRSDGTNFPVEYWSYPILKDGEGIGSVVTFIDITERKQAEMTMRFALQEAEVSREKIAAILKSVTDGLIVTDLNRRVVLMNRAAEKFLGTTLGEAFSRPVQDLIPAKGVAEEVLGILRGQVPGEGQEWEQSDAASDRAWMIQARSSGVKGAGGNISGAITTLRDVTREREIDQMKNEFISTAAHELRTPLTSVLGYTELLLNPEEYGISGEEQRREYLNYVYDKAQALGGIIEDLLDLSRVQAGKVLSLSPGPCEIGALLGKVVDPYRKLSSRHRFELVLPEEPVTLVADQKKLEQVLDNLISNAVKFSPDGGEIRVKGQVLKGRYQVTVRDEGIGMTSEGVARVFDKFYRVDASTTAVAGLGLGMAIAKSIIDAHGGTIRVESEPGKGTKVTFSLPLA